MFSHSDVGKLILELFCSLSSIVRSVDIPFQHVVEDLGPAQSPSTTDQKDNRDEFTADEFDGKDLTGGNLKMLTRSLKALAQDDNKPQDLEVALDVRPALIQASNLLVRHPPAEHQALYFFVGVGRGRVVSPP